MSPMNYFFADYFTYLLQQDRKLYNLCWPHTWAHLQNEEINHCEFRWGIKPHYITYIHIRLIITYDTPHSGTMIYAVTLRNSSVSRYRKIVAQLWFSRVKSWSRDVSRLVF